MDRPILEREHELAVLADAVADAAGGIGSVVLVYGEAGIGKSRLVGAVRGLLPATGRMLVGLCDDLTTRRTLGPFRDLIGSVGSQLAAALSEGTDRDRVLGALRAELDRPGHPAVLAIEDVHWADDATLDALRFLVRRIASLPVVLMLSYRDDELTGDHPLRDLIALAATRGRTRRLPLRRLSPQAVATLSAGRADAAQVYAVTAGNPFFVTEVIAAGAGTSVPPTVVDAVLARLRRLEPAAREAVEQLSVVPSAVDLWLVEKLVPGGLGTLAVAEQRGLLVVTARRVEFRHELTRRAIVDALPAARRVALHRPVLAALVARGGDLAQIVHHAAGAGDLDAIVQFGPRAAREAAAAGAHRQAAAHYRLVLEQRHRFPPAELAELLEQYAIECYTIGAAHEAVAGQRDAVQWRQELGDPAALGSALRWLSRMQWWAGDRPGAEQTARSATTVLERTGDQRLLAMALSNQSQLHVLAHRSAEGVRLGKRAAALARAVGDAATLSHALTNIGLSRWVCGDPEGRAIVEEALRVALDANEPEPALRAYQGLISSLLDEYRLDEADHYLASGQALAERAEFRGFFEFQQLERARLEFARGQWDDAVRTVQFALAGRPPLSCPALTAIGRVRVRRGEAGGEALLARAWRLAVGMDELQRTAPVAIALAEAAWLRGDHAQARAIVDPVYREARRLAEVHWAAELGYWLAAAGQAVPPIDTDHPYALQAAGRWREAAAAWRAAGCPYEHASALAESDDPQDLLAALAELTSLGAKPLARVVRGRLRERGVRSIPRGPAGTTRRNPAGLTQRQVEVVRLLGQGLTNPEIAERLVLSVRTVDSHVAAVLDKLGAATRREAVAKAAELGLLTSDRVR